MGVVPVGLLGIGIIGGLFALKKKKSLATTTTTGVITQPTVMPMATTTVTDVGVAAPIASSVIPPLKQTTYLDETGYVSKPVNRKYIFRPTLWTKAKSLFNPLNKW
jgi:hypothetical protein